MPPIVFFTEYTVLLIAKITTNATCAYTLIFAGAYKRTCIHKLHIRVTLRHIQYLYVRLRTRMKVHRFIDLYTRRHIHAHVRLFTQIYE